MSKTELSLAWPGIGQSFLERHLIDALDRGSLPRAVLFVGPQGLGKGSSAQWLAQYDVCTAAKKPCGNCQNCLRLMRGEHPQCTVLRGSESIGVDDIRSVLQVYTRSAVERHRRWFVISDAERLTEQASNLLLKFLEELPSYVQVIMTTSQSSGLLSTVVSRVTVYYWKFVSSESLRQEGLTREEVRYALGRPEWRMTPADRQSDLERYKTFCSGKQAIRISGTAKRKSEVEHILRAEELYLREQLLSASQISTRRRWTDDSHGRSGVAEVIQRLERYLQRYDLSEQVQGKILYDNLHLA